MIKRIVLIGLLLSAVAQCTQWVHIADSDLSTLHGDADSVVRRANPDYVMAWFRFDLKSGEMRLVRYEFDKPAHYIRILSMHVYDKAGGKETQFLETVGEWQSLVPGSVMETAYDWLFRPAR
jgi:hypothetical protein